jgi:outer membrane protein OmpA-like peptidoglycan-associated protein
MPNKVDLSHTFVDLMTSLAIIFILLLVATLNNAASTGVETIQNLKNQVAEEVKLLGLRVENDPDDSHTLTIRLDDNKVKFEFKKADLTESGAKLISDLFIQLTPKLCDPQFAGKIESVFVEGHTDSFGNQTMSGKLDNVKLSQDRAFAVMKQAFLALDRKNMIKEEEALRKVATAIGRGSSKPLPDQPDAASRRVEIKIRVKETTPKID